MSIYGVNELRQIRRIMLKPIVFNDLIINVVDILHAEHAKDWVYSEHEDIWFEFNYVCKGSVYTQLDGKEFRVSAGEAYIVPPMVPHSHRNCNGIGDDGYCIRFSVDIKKGDKENPGYALLKDIFDSLQVPRAYSFGFDGDRFIKDMDGLSELAIQLKFIQFMLFIYELHVKPETEIAADGESEEVLLAKKIIFYMKKYHGAEFSVNQMAKSFHLSYRHLSRIFKSATGVTIVHKLNEIRIDHAKKLLAGTDMYIKDIAEEIGLVNQYYFSKLFYEYEQITPSQYRAGIRKSGTGIAKYSYEKTKGGRFD